jgi:hypothetical protein
MSQSFDDREAILARLAAVLAATPGVTHFARNDLALPENSVPAILLLDGDETVNEDAYDRGSRLPGSVKIVTLDPEVYILVEDDPLLVGPSLSQLRRRVVKAVLTDDELLGLAVDKGVRYVGMQTGLAMGRSMSGEAALNFSIKYQFDALQLPPINSNIYLEGSVSSGGLVSGRLAQAIAGDIEGGGELTGALALTLSGSVEGGGTVTGSLDHNVHLSGSVEGGGTLTGSFGGVVELMGTVEGEGALTGDLTVQRVLAGSIEAGGTLDGDLTIQRALSGSVSGGGELEGDLSVLVTGSPEIVDHTALQSSASGFSVNYPGGVDIGDTLVLFVGSANQAIATPSGWSVGAVDAGGGVAGAAGARVSTFYKTYTASESSVAIADTGTVTIAGMVALRNVSTLEETRNAFASGGSTVTPTVSILAGDGVVGAIGLNAFMASTSVSISAVQSQSPSTFTGQVLEGAALQTGIYTMAMYSYEQISVATNASMPRLTLGANASNRTVVGNIFA